MIERDAPGARTSRVSFGWIDALGKRPEHYHRLSRLSVEDTFEGDVLIHPAQVTETDWRPRFDGDSELATATRRKMLE